MKMKLPLFPLLSLLALPPTTLSFLPIVPQIKPLHTFKSTTTQPQPFFAKGDDDFKGAEEATDGSAGVRQLLGVKGKAIV